MSTLKVRLALFISSQYNLCARANGNGWWTSLDVGRCRLLLSGVFSGAKHSSENQGKPQPFTMAKKSATCAHVDSQKSNTR